MLSTIANAANAVSISTGQGRLQKWVIVAPVSVFLYAANGS